ncbi:hypothetical protein TcCL_NonESM08321 [Trypanosoma cruzi]|nr:hypothetical protein TcCL_NonESM08321 [Trypanosoma cruzi]
MLTQLTLWCTSRGDCIAGINGLASCCIVLPTRWGGRRVCWMRRASGLKGGGAAPTYCFFGARRHEVECRVLYCMRRRCRRSCCWCGVHHTHTITRKQVTGCARFLLRVCGVWCCGCCALLPFTCRIVDEVCVCVFASPLPCRPSNALDGVEAVFLLSEVSCCRRHGRHVRGPVTRNTWTLHTLTMRSAAFIFHCFCVTLHAGHWARAAERNVENAVASAAPCPSLSAACRVSDVTVVLNLLVAGAFY